MTECHMHLQDIKFSPLFTDQNSSRSRPAIRLNLLTKTTWKLKTPGGMLVFRLLVQVRPWMVHKWEVFNWWTGALVDRLLEPLKQTRMCFAFNIMHDLRALQFQSQSQLDNGLSQTKTCCSDSLKYNFFYLFFIETYKSFNLQLPQVQKTNQPQNRAGTTMSRVLSSLNNISVTHSES